MEPEEFSYGYRDPAVGRAFWQYVRQDSDTEAMTIRAALAGRGWTPRPSEEVSDEELPRALERLVLDLSWLQIYLQSTDHLDDRTLYEGLLEGIRYDEISLWPDDPDSAITLSFVAGGTDEENDTWLRYYASDGEREQWAREYPDEPLPPSELPPFPRPWLPARPGL